MGGKQHKKFKKKQNKKQVVDAPNGSPAEEKLIPQVEHTPQVEQRKVDPKPTMKPVHRPPDSLVAVGGLYAGICVALIYLFQLLAMNKSVELARQSLEVQERP